MKISVPQREKQNSPTAWGFRHAVFLIRWESDLLKTTILLKVPNFFIGSHNTPNSLIYIRISIQLTSRATYNKKGYCNNLQILCKKHKFA